MQQPIIKVGILGAANSEFRLNGQFSETRLADGARYFRALSPDATFTLPRVKIGIDFHWERYESQTFQGNLIICKDKLIINELPVEQYLRSVISSEMNAAAPFEFLKAHAIVARSWLIAMLERSRNQEPAERRHEHVQFNEEHQCREITRWYDREAHTRFDVCADDHCQRYQGINRAKTNVVADAVEQTRGIVLTYGGKVCDARFSKCCGGRTERFSTAWEDEDVPYLQSVSDTDAEGNCYCDGASPELMHSLVNNYDLDSPDIFRWEEVLPTAYLSGLVQAKADADLGTIRELRPLQRGESGRIQRLLVRGDRGSVIIGKELEIRRSLSPTHLKSSDFEVITEPNRFILRGKGWGHGVGLCQIGAAVMATKGADHISILKHYFSNAELSKLYE
jgi:SpoIID/LytB domain protein